MQVLMIIISSSLVLAAPDSISVQAFKTYELCHRAEVNLRQVMAEVAPPSARLKITIRCVRT